jgi:hypothetical protein
MINDGEVVSYFDNIADQLNTLITVLGPNIVAFDDASLNKLAHVVLNLVSVPLFDWF